MGTFSVIKKQVARQPARTLLLEPWVFADDWPSKPKSPVCVGLRLMSDGDKSKARAEAERMALELHPNGGHNAIDAYNDALVRQCAALGLCSPNDVEKPSEVFPFAEDQLRMAVTSRGAQFIFDALLKYEVEISPLYPEASDEEFAELIGELGAGTLGAMGGEPGRTARRFLRYALDEIRAHEALRIGTAIVDKLVDEERPVQRQAIAADLANYKKRNGQ